MPNKRNKTSVYTGISLHRRSRTQKVPRWLARYLPEKFWKEYHSEMEALSHRMAVVKYYHPKGRFFIELLKSCPASRGRPDADVVNHYDEEGKRQLAVDHDYIIKIDEATYKDSRDYYWFVKNKRVMTVVKVKSVTEVGNKRVFEFEYIGLDEVVLMMARQKMGLKPLPRGILPTHLDGDFLNCRLANLADPSVTPATNLPKGVINPLSAASMEQARRAEWNPELVEEEVGPSEGEEF